MKDNQELPQCGPHDLYIAFDTSGLAMETAGLSGCQPQASWLPMQSLPIARGPRGILLKELDRSMLSLLQQRNLPGVYLNSE